MLQDLWSAIYSNSLNVVRKQQDAVRKIIVSVDRFYKTFLRILKLCSLKVNIVNEQYFIKSEEPYPSLKICTWNYFSY